VSARLSDAATENRGRKDHAVELSISLPLTGCRTQLLFA
jgi:hypothetical protein